MSVPLPPRKRARGRRRPTGQPRLLVDVRYYPVTGRWLASLESYRDDLAREPDRIEVLPHDVSVLQIVTRIAEVLENLRPDSRPLVGAPALDLREPGARSS